MTASHSSEPRSPKRRRSAPEITNRPAKRCRGGGNPNASNVQGASSLGAVFSGVQHAHTYGGVYTAVGGDYVIHNYNTYHILPQSQNPTSQRQQIGKEKAIQNSCNLMARARASSLDAEETSFAELFPQIRQSLEFIKQLIGPHLRPEGPCHGISGDLDELSELVNVSSLAYQACDSHTLVGKLLTNAIDTRMLQCKTVLMGVHQDLVAVLHRSLPLAPLGLVFDVVYRWWTGSEPKAIAAARLALNAEAKGVGQWLCDLKLFYWAESLLHSRKASFSWRTLEDFLRSGPTLLREMHVEKIVIIEPLQGEALSIPLRFAQSFEDVHRIVQFACEGTKGSRFIESRQYQLDESITNVTVHPTEFRASLEDGKSFEVTMLLQASSLVKTDCPRCGYQHDESLRRDDHWIRCKGCHTLFNSQISETDPTTSESGLEEEQVSWDAPKDKIEWLARSSAGRNGQRGQHESDRFSASGDHDDDDDTADPNSEYRFEANEGGVTYTGNANLAGAVDPWTLFRRMRIKLLGPPKILKGLLNEPMTKTAGMPNGFPLQVSGLGQTLGSSAASLVYAGSEFSYDDVPREYRAAGPGWFAAFNPRIKRRLDIELVHSFQHMSVVCCVHFSQDGRFLATGCNHTSQIFEVKSGLKVCELSHEHGVYMGDLYIRSVRFSPDGKLLATGAEDGQIRIWEIARKRIRQVLKGHQAEIYSLDFSQDGRLIISGSGDRTTRIWDMNDATNCKVFTTTDMMDPYIDVAVSSVAISPSACLVAASSLDNLIRVWDVETGLLLEKLRGHTNGVHSVAFTPDSKGLVTGSLDKILKLWDLSHLNSVEGRRKAADNPDQRDRVERERMERMEIGEGKIMQNANCLMDFIRHKDYVLSVAVSSDYRWVVSGSKDKCVHVWDSNTATLQLMLHGHKNSVLSVDLNSTSDLLATGSGDMCARIWSLVRI